MTGTATLMINGRKQFFYANGSPLAGGSVYYYIPATTTAKTTWLDSAQGTANTNPITLDSAGTCVVYGSGLYREYVLDSLGNLIQDALTSDSQPSTELLTGIVFTSAAAVTSSDTVLSAIGKLQTQSPISYASISALRAFSGTPAASVEVLGFYTAGDGGGGTFAYVSTDTTSADNGGTIIVDAANHRWYRTAGGRVSVKCFGAKIDGSTDDTTAWNNAIASGVPILHPGGANTSIYTGALALGATTSIMGVGSYFNTVGQGFSQTSTITFHGNGAGLVLANGNGGGFTLEKIGFFGVPGTYTSQTGLFMNDSLRSGLGEGWPTLRDVLFANFNIGILVGATYQTGYMYNVYCYNSTSIGYQNKSTDWYHHGIYCGNGGTTASTAQLVIGSLAGPTGLSSGFHQFHGGAFFGGNYSVIIQCTSMNKFMACDIQNATVDGVQIGDGTNFADGTRFIGCSFSGNNAAGGARNVNATQGADIRILAASRGTIIHGNKFAIVGAGGSGGACVSEGIVLNTSTEVTIIQGNAFDMDMIVTPSTTPVAILATAAQQEYSLDRVIIDGNIASYGEQGILTFAQLPVNITSIAEPYTTATEVSIAAGTAIINAGSTIACTVINPGYAGRRLVAISEAPSTGNTLSASTSGGFGSGHTTITFTAAGGFADMISNSGSTWQIINSGSITLS